MFDTVRHRCSTDQPILADAVRTLALDAPPDLRASLEGLADRLMRRTTLRPNTVSVPAVAVALNQLLSHMVDRDTFTVRHELALRYFRGDI
ncbi:MAG: hypothetical protein MUF19_01955 [Candidatus Pacebacteria bacterium]|jgi:hypothetical protein|nr:hypothetical protein [Candidatus Paceibacterota bacterium]